MFAKVMTLIVFATATAALLLALRQKRFESMHEMAALHSQMNRSRQVMWDYQVRIADQTKPAAIQQALERAAVRLEPMAPPLPVLVSAAQQTTAVAEQTHGRR